jgi:hypothetical protein
MFWRILPHATLCAASNRLILLDVRQDRYLMMPDDVDRDLRGWLEDEARLAPPRVIRLLSQAGILRDGDGRPTSAGPFAVAIPATLAGPPAERGIGRIRDAARVGALVAASWLALRCKPLQQILHDAERRQIPPGAAPSARIPAAVGSFDRARTYVPVARRCLLDSLALQAWLRRHREHSRLVFGVTGQPFAAHCWLQNDHAILNDSYERVSRFTPILAI